MFLVFGNNPFIAAHLRPLVVSSLASALYDLSPQVLRSPFAFYVETVTFFAGRPSLERLSCDRIVSNNAGDPSQRSGIRASVLLCPRQDEESAARAHRLKTCQSDHEELPRLHATLGGKTV